MRAVDPLGIYEDRFLKPIHAVLEDIGSALQARGSPGEMETRMPPKTRGSPRDRKTGPTVKARGFPRDETGDRMKLHTRYAGEVRWDRDPCDDVCVPTTVAGCDAD